MVKLYSGLVLLLIYIGVFFRHKKKIHVPIMLVCAVLDLGSVYYLEVSRHVIQEAFERVAPKLLMKIHLTFAVTTLRGYAVALCTGTLLILGKRVRFIHKINAALFLIARTGIIITSFWVVK